MLCQFVGCLAVFCLNASRLLAWTQDTAMPLLGIGIALMLISERLEKRNRAAPSANPKR